MLKEKEKEERSLLKRKEERKILIRKELSKFELKTIGDLLLSERLPEEVFEELMAYEEKFNNTDESCKIFCKITLLRSALHFIHSHYNNKKIADSETVEICSGFIGGLYSMVMFDNTPDPTIDDLMCAEEAVALVVNLYADSRKSKLN